MPDVATLSLLERAADALADSAKDSNYGVHSGDYVVPYGETRLPHMAEYEACDCVLCDLRRFIAVTRSPCKGMEIEPGVVSGCDQSAGDCPTCGK